MPFSESHKEEVRRRAYHRCCICQEVRFIEVHHIIPESEGGPDTEENAAPLCAGCHDLYGNDPQKRKQIREMRDQWYEICERLFDQDVLVALAAKVEQKVEEAINGVVKRLGDSGTADPIELQAEIDSLRHKLTDMQLLASQLRSALEQKIMQELLESSWESWPGGGFMGSGPREAEARELLAEATNNTYQVVMDWKERFVYYLLLKSGGRVESYDFLEFAFNEFVSAFPSPKPAGKTQVLSALGELSLKGFIKAPPDFTPGTEIAIVQPFPHAWQVQSRPESPQSQPGVRERQSKPLVF